MYKCLRSKFNRLNLSDYCAYDLFKTKNSAVLCVSYEFDTVTNYFLQQYELVSKCNRGSLLFLTYGMNLLIIFR
jgi:hypothetical protein